MAVSLDIKSHNDELVATLHGAEEFARAELTSYARRPVTNEEIVEVLERIAADPEAASTLRGAFRRYLVWEFEAAKIDRTNTAEKGGVK